MRDYGCDAIVNDELATRIFFKEIKDSSADKDSKYLYAYNGQVKQGDSIEIDARHWLVIQEDISYHKQYTRFIVREANQLINFVIDEALYSTNGYIVTGNQSSDNQAISLINGKLMVIVQANAMTDKIKTSDRIIKFSQAWKIIATSTENNGLINIYCESDTFAPDDDKENEIPSGVATWDISFDEPSKEINLDSSITLEPIIMKNGIVVSDGYELEWGVADESVLIVNNGVVQAIAEGSTEVTVSIKNKNESATILIDVVSVEVAEYRITPSDRIVYSIFGAVDYSVNKYVNGVIVPESFTITASGLTTAQYTLQVVNGNDFKLTSKGYVANKLTVRCVAQSDGYVHEEQFSMYNM